MSIPNALALFNLKDCRASWVHCTHVVTYKCALASLRRKLAATWTQRKLRIHDSDCIKYRGANKKNLDRRPGERRSKSWKRQTNGSTKSFTRALSLPYRWSGFYFRTEYPMLLCKLARIVIGLLLCRKNCQKNGSRRKSSNFHQTSVLFSIVSSSILFYKKYLTF